MSMLKLKLWNSKELPLFAQRCGLGQFRTTYRKQ